MLSNLLFYRFVIWNVLMWTFVGALAINGIVAPIFANDTSNISYAIAGLFILGSLWMVKEIGITSFELNEAKSNGGPFAIHECQRVKDMAKVAWLGSVTDWLVSLGMIGTVWGFTIALSGIAQSSVGDASGAQAAVGSLMVGMKIALNTTLLGLALAVWHDVNVRMLRTGLEILWADRIEAYHRGGGPNE